MRVLALIAVAACSIPDQTFVPSTDAPVEHDATPDAASLGFIIDRQSLQITEGMTDTFTVSLSRVPDSVVTVMVSSTLQAVDVTPESIDFTPSNFNVPVTVSVTPMADANDVAEMSTVAVEATGIPPGSVDIRVLDPTILGTAGWPPPAFPTTQSIAGGSVVAYQVTITNNASLDKFGAYIPAGTGFYRMALYRDSGNMPSTLVAQIGGAIAVANGENVFDLVPDVTIDTSTSQRFWIAIRTSPANSIAYSDTTMGNLCVRQQDITNINDAWPATFGTANCLTDYLMNLWITTYR